SGALFVCREKEVDPMSTERMQVAVIGCGGWGAAGHIGGFQLLPEARLVAVCDSREAVARETAERFGVPHVYTNYREMLQTETLDVVSVATPPLLHYSMAMDAVAAGKHVLCEKPLAMKAVEAREMLRKASAAGVVHAIDHEFRFLPTNFKIKELVDQGYIGKLNTMNVAVAYSAGSFQKKAKLSRWQSQKSKGGGILLTTAYHYVDLMRYWFGEIAGVYARLLTVGGRGNTDSDDTYAIVFELTSGGMVTMTGTSAAVLGKGNRLEVYGSEGTLISERWKLETPGRLLGGRKGDSSLSELPLGIPDVPPSDRPQLRAFAAVARRLIKSIRQGTPMSPDFSDGVKSQEVIDAIRQSAVENRWVTVDKS
ncbi:Gfo/Idh/MocA family protein, partial [Chloroflexota bacterium]